MINAGVLLKNHQDKHLNIFWQYEGKPNHENNITKAFINSIDAMNFDHKRILFKELFDYVLPDDVRFHYELQKDPDPALVDNARERKLFAFSPTGKMWGHPGIDVDDIPKTKESIRKAFLDSYPNASQKEIKEHIDSVFEEIESIKKGQTGARPDAWIFVFNKNNDSEPLLCIAMENKLWDLNPYQLRRHRETALRDKNCATLFKTYAAIIDSIYRCREYITDEFLRYMYHLGHWGIDRLSQLDGVSCENAEDYANEYCVQLLERISGHPAIWHRDWMYSANIDSPYANMIGFEYNKQSKRFVLYVYLGPVQTKAKALYEHIKQYGIALNPTFSYRNSFHFHMYGKGNYDDTYFPDKCSINTYIDFWKDRTNQIYRKKTVQERKDILSEMLSEKLISPVDYNRIFTCIENKGDRLNIVPEIGAIKSWSLSTAIELDKKGKFEDSVKEAVQDAFKSFRITDPVVYKA